MGLHLRALLGLVCTNTLVCQCTRPAGICLAVYRFWRVWGCSAGEPIPWLTKVAEDASSTVLSLLSKPFPGCPSPGVELDQQQSTFLSRAVAAVLIALTSVHAAPQSWIGSAAQTLLPLLRHPGLQTPTKKAIELTLQVHSRHASCCHCCCAYMYLIYIMYFIGVHACFPIRMHVPIFADNM